MARTKMVNGKIVPMTAAEEAQADADAAARDLALAADQARRAELAAIDADIGADPLFQKLMTATPAEIRAWMTANVTNLATAIPVLSKMAVILAHLLRAR